MKKMKKLPPFMRKGKKAEMHEGYESKPGAMHEGYTKKKKGKAGY